MNGSSSFFKRLAIRRGISKRLLHMVSDIFFEGIYAQETFYMFRSSAHVLCLEADGFLQDSKVGNIHLLGLTDEKRPDLRLVNTVVKGDVCCESSNGILHLVGLSNIEGDIVGFDKVIRS